MISRKSHAEFRRTVEALPPFDIAKLMEEIPEEYRAAFYRLLPKDIAADVFAELDFELAEELVSVFSDSELQQVLSELYIDDTVDIIEEMPAVVVKRILKNSSPENRNAINELLRYPKNSAGSIMTTEYVKLKPDMSVLEALTHIREVAIEKETVYNCYVTDEKRRLIGVVSAKRLLVSSLDVKLSEIMEEAVVFANTTDDREYVAGKIEKYGFIALPVVDNECRLVGIVTVDDAIDVLREEAEEDFAKMAAIIPGDKEYLKTSAFSIFKARIPWLLILMISATFSSAILGFFEASLIPVLVLFVPMLMDTGGNSGSQASVTAIRGLSTGEVTLRDVFKVLTKEILVGLMLGAVLGVVAFVKIIVIDGLLFANPAVTYTVAFAVSISLTLTIVGAKIIGSTLPFLAKRIGVDPAVMASPFITTLVDVVGLMMYFAVSAYAFGLTV
ncbi:MAG: magnesium transporter [Ruminococcaceae bacterium]|nr:magnesium transporter [Oscillospiraceae bacterium]